MLTPAFAGELFGPGQPLDAAKYFIILPDALGHGKSTKPSDGLRAKFPRYNYDDMVDAQYRLVTEDLGVQPPAPRHRQLHGRHADLDLGREVSRLHGRAGADGLAAHRDVEPQLDDAPPDHRLDPQRPRLERRQLHRRSRTALQRSGRVLRHRHQRRHAGLPEAGAHARERPTSCSTSASPAPFTADANDFLYQWDSSRDYNPSPGLEHIEAALLAINSADDERNPPETGAHGARAEAREERPLYLIPASEDTRGHGTTGMAKFYAKQLQEFLQAVPRRSM